MEKLSLFSRHRKYPKKSGEIMSLAIGKNWSSQTNLKSKYRMQYSKSYLKVKSKPFEFNPFFRISQLPQNFPKFSTKHLSINKHHFIIECYDVFDPVLCFIYGSIEMTNYLLGFPQIERLRVLTFYINRLLTQFLEHSFGLIQICHSVAYN